MRLLANENFPRVAVEGLRHLGHDVVWGRTDMPGATDDVVLERARQDERFVVTFDKDFGELAYYWGLPATCGIILFRLRTQSPEYLLSRIVETFSSHTNWSGNFVVVEDFRIRVRPLPGHSTEKPGR